jgi:hypothetical protein
MSIERMARRHFRLTVASALLWLIALAAWGLWSLVRWLAR